MRTTGSDLVPVADGQRPPPAYRSIPGQEAPGDTNGAWRKLYPYIQDLQREVDAGGRLSNAEQQMLSAYRAYPYAAEEWLRAYHIGAGTATAYEEAASAEFRKQIAEHGKDGYEGAFESAKAVGEIAQDKFDGRPAAPSTLAYVEARRQGATHVEAAFWLYNGKPPRNPRLPGLWPGL